jgi:hypothetical protein
MSSRLTSSGLWELDMPHANMPKSIDNAFPRQDSISDHQVLKLII